MTNINLLYIKKFKLSNESNTSLCIEQINDVIDELIKKHNEIIDVVKQLTEKEKR